MATFIEIDFELFENILDIAKANGNQLRPKNSSHSSRIEQFMIKHNIDRLLVERAIGELLDKNHRMKLTIIDKGRGEGLYLYTWYNSNDDFCYKFKKNDTYLFERDNWGSSNW